MTIVRIPADVEIPDRVLGPLTARQLAIIAGTGGVLYGIWYLSRPLVPVGVFVALATPVVIVAVTVALGHRDGISLDRLLLAAMRQRTSPRHHTTAQGDDAALDAPPWLTANSTPPGGDHTRRQRRAAGTRSGSPVPARSVEPGIGEIGVVDLATDGLAVLAVAAPVNLALRTPTEQDALVATFARYLHGLTAPVQILVRTEHLDLRRQITDLRDSAAQLPHPALAAAALEHADYLTQLGAQNVLLRRQVLLVLREPRATGRLSEQSGTGSFAAGSSWWPRRREHEAGWSEHARRAAESRLTGRLTEAVDILAAAGVVVTPLDAAQATAVLACACDPGRTPAASGTAGADDVVTTARHRPDDGARAAYRDQRRPGETEQRDDGWADPDDRFTDDDLDRLDRGGSRSVRRRGWR